MKHYLYHSEYGDYELTLGRDSYVANDSLAVTASLVDGGPFAVLTVNLPDSDLLDEDEAYVDVNNLPGVERFLVDNAIAKPTGMRAFSGYCTYPCYKFDLSLLEDEEVG